MYLLLAAFVGVLQLPQPAGGEVVAIGAGLARTGTNSLKAALELLLGSKSVSLEDVVGTDELDDWLRFLADRSDRTLLRKLVQGYSSVTSLPGAFVYKELLEEFPNAKVILTRHPHGSDAWYRSTMGTIFRLNYEIFNQTWIGHIPSFKRVHAQLREMYLDSAFMTKDQWEDEIGALAKYEDWNAEVQRHVPQDQLLVFSADQGWEPLCKFLGKPVPTEPFPYAHSHGTNMRIMGVVLTTVRFGVPVLLLAAWYWFMQKATRKGRKAVKKE